MTSQSGGCVISLSQDDRSAVDSPIKIFHHTVSVITSVKSVDALAN